MRGLSFRMSTRWEGTRIWTVVDGGKGQKLRLFEMNVIHGHPHYVSASTSPLLDFPFNIIIFDLQCVQSFHETRLAYNKYFPRPDFYLKYSRILSSVGSFFFVFVEKKQRNNNKKNFSMKKLSLFGDALFRLLRCVLLICVWRAFENSCVRPATYPQNIHSLWWKEKVFLKN